MCDVQSHDIEIIMIIKIIVKAPYTNIVYNLVKYDYICTIGIKLNSDTSVVASNYKLQYVAAMRIASFFYQHDCFPKMSFVCVQKVIPCLEFFEIRTNKN